MSETKQLAEFAAQLRFSDLPPAVVEKAKEFILHAWGVQLAGSTLPLSKSIYRYIRSQGGTAESTTLNYGLKTSAANAAFANGAFGHGFEMDDNHAMTSVKGGCVVVPAGLAMGERQVSSGKDFILAVVAGYEIMVRVALSVTPVLMQRGHQPTGSCGPFGAAITAGKLLGLGESGLLHALATAAVHAGGLVEAPASGRGDLKRIFGAMAASGGIRSALLAEAGLTAPATMLEGERGYCRAYGDSVNMPALTAGLGSKWHLLDAHYKVYAQDGFLQPMTEGLERIVKKHKFGVDDIETVKIGASKEAQYWVGVIREPKDITSAQFSGAFSLAMFLVKGDAGFLEYTDESLRDPEIIKLSRRVEFEVDDEIEAEFKKTRPRGARVTVRLRSGETFIELVPSLRALTAAEVEAKFRKLASAGLPEEQCERVVSAVHDLTEVRNVAMLSPLLTRA